ncbi:MAG: tetratricopeptide repeat protein [Candidatus Kuenenia sp.]|nr:tetratricopeptide repeat protein [Candidatus Kuenenia hertensis]
MNINKKRIIVLFSINVFIIVHILLWYKYGFQKVGTFSLNGIVNLFGFGLLNSAAVFFIIIVLLTVFFGRVFCGWGCHFAFFQELALKVLNKCGIYPSIIHSRANIIQYVFLLKTITAIFEFWYIYGLPQFHINIGDTQVMTSDLPRSPVIIALFILFDAFLFIYLMGSRAFCRYVCPWAPMLAIFENISFWRIRKISECTGCMSCTRSCTMGIAVHQEIARHGAVVNANCIRCLSCKNACQNGTLSYKWGVNVLSMTRKFRWLIPEVSNYNLYTELVIIFCGIIAAFYTQKYFGSFQTFLGAAWGLCFAVIIFKILERKSVKISEPVLRKRKLLALSLIMLSTLAWCRGTLVPPETRLLMRGNRFIDIMEYDKAILTYTNALNEYPSNKQIRSALALAYKNNGNYEKAIIEYKALIAEDPENAVLRNNLGTVYYRKGDYDVAIEEYKRAILFDKSLTAAYGNIGLILLEKGNVEEAVYYLKNVFTTEEEMYQYLLTYYGSKQGQI